MAKMVDLLECQAPYYVETRRNDDDDWRVHSGDEAFDLLLTARARQKTYLYRGEQARICDASGGVVPTPLPGEEPLW